jgi:hypothetical protein
MDIGVLGVSRLRHLVVSSYQHLDQSSAFIVGLGATDYPKLFEQTTAFIIGLEE